MIDKKYLLNSKQMANFVADGYLRFDELVPTGLNEAVHAEMDDHGIGRGTAGDPLSESLVRIFAHWICLSAS